MKYYLLLAIVLIGLILISKTLSCERKVSKVENKANESGKVDSIQRLKTDSIIFQNNSLIRKYEIKDSINTASLKVLNKSYNAARAEIRHLKSILVLSDTQVVIVPVIEYNTLIESGNKCDSIQEIQGKIIAEKDCINKLLSENVLVERKAKEACHVAYADSRSLVEEEKNKGEKARWWNRQIPKIGATVAVIASLFTIFVLK